MSAVPLAPAREPERYVGSRWLRRTNTRPTKPIPELTVVGLSLRLVDGQGRALLEVKTRGGRRGVRSIDYLREHYREVLARRATGDLETPEEWFGRTGHCWGCGQPGSYCLCRESDPCPCQGLHAMGSGLVPGALEAFGGQQPMEEDQVSLFGDGEAG